jgi:serine/threonine protein kinase
VPVKTTKTPALSTGQVLKVSFSRGGPFEVSVVRPLGPTRTVYLGRRVGSEEPYVLKIPRGRPGIEDRIEREITAQFNHPNLVQLVGTAVVEGRTILVLPKLAPNPLLLLNERQIRARLTNDPGTKYYPVPPNVAVELLAELLRGLEALHAAGFAHNDVKISNLLVDAGKDFTGVRSLEGCARGQYRGVIIDLGAARSLAFLEDAKRGAIDTDFVPPQLTPAYASPEVLTTEGRPTFGPAADMYAAGLTAYALYTGHYPYDHIDPPPTFADFGEVAALKSRERKNELAPIDLNAIDYAPYHDMEIMSRETSREAIEASFRDLLRRMVSADPAKRPTASKALAELEWIFQLDNRKGRSFVSPCKILRLRNDNRLTDAIARYNEDRRPTSSYDGQRVTQHLASQAWPTYQETPLDAPSSNPLPEDPSAERAWSRQAATGEISSEELLRYALRAVEGLVTASEPAAPAPPPPPPPENVEYEALLKVIGAALGSGIPAPMPPPPPQPAPGIAGIGDLLAWHRGEADAGLPAEGFPLLKEAPQSPYAYPPQMGSQMGFLDQAPAATPTPAAMSAYASEMPRVDAIPELREMKKAELFTVRDVWIAAALSRSGLMSPEQIAEALGAHVTLKRPLAAILRERYLNTEVVEALRVLARALAKQPHEI